MAKSKPAPDGIAAAFYERGDLDVMRQLRSDIDQFAMKVGATLQEVMKRLEKLEVRLVALGALQGLAWQSGWLPAQPTNGKSDTKPAAYPGFDVKEHTGKMPEGAVPSLHGGFVYPTYL